MAPTNDPQVVIFVLSQVGKLSNILSLLVAAFRPDKADAHAMALVNQKMTNKIVATKSYTLKKKQESQISSTHMSISLIVRFIYPPGSTLS